MKKLFYSACVILIIASCKKEKESIPDLIASAPVADIDGNIYNTVIIGTQTWMKENLKTTRYRNGDTIPNITDDNEWGRSSTGAWCYYDNEPANNADYGKLYNWNAVNDSRGIAPLGFHIPSEAEWATFLGGRSGSGEMREAGTEHWEYPNTEATNSSGFTGLPGGMREFGRFRFIGNCGLWWSSTESFNYPGWGLYQYFRLSVNDLAGIYDSFNGNGISIRCVKD